MAKDGSKLSGQLLKENPEIKKLIKALVAEAQKVSQEISGPRDAQAGRAASSEKLIADVNALRGRPLFYPYIGSGAGHGAYVEVEDGSVKLDLINGIGIHIMGHSNPDVMEACIEGARFR